MNSRRKGVIVGKKFALVVMVLCCLTVVGCILDFSGDGDGDSGTDNLTSYMAINHGFINDVIDSWRWDDNALMSQERERQLQGAASTAIKIVGKVAQIAIKIKDKQDKANFEDEVLSDLKDIKEELDDLDRKVTDGFAQILNEVKRSEFLDAWNSLSDNYLTKIDTVWDYYLNDAGTGLVDKLAKLDSEESSCEDVEDDVTAFIGHIQDYEDDLKDALTNIEHHVSGTNGFSKILSLYGDYLAGNNDCEFTDPDVMDSVLAQYLYMYMDLLAYQCRATILLDEYYNYQLDSDEIILDEDGYNTVISDEARDQNAELLADLKNGLGVFLNNGERLISQFNAGDIYRNYTSRATAIRNSDWYPYIDVYIQTIYGYEDLFVFRLAWSEEAGSNDPDAWLEDKTVTGEYGYNYDYQSLFDGLANAGNTLDFFLLDDTGSKYADPVTDADHSGNLSTISTFSLYPRGRTDKDFQAGVRRYVFVNLPTDKSLTLTFQSDLQEYCTFKYSHGDFPYHNSDVYETHFYLYDPNAVNFSMDGLLNDNNPLAASNFNPTTVSYTFGAYMVDFEYLADKNTLFDSSLTYEEQIKSLYGPFNYEYYHVERSGNQHIEIADKQNCGFTIVPDGDESTPICDGQQVVVYMMYRYNDKDHHGYMYQPTEKSDKTIKFKEGKDNAIRFNIEKKYIFPSGKLFSNNVIKQFNYFMLTNGDLCVHSMSDDHDNRLDYYDNNPFSMNNWFFLDSDVPWWF